MNISAGHFAILGHSVSPWIVAAVFLTVWLSLGWTLKKILFVWFGRLTQKSQTLLDDILIASASTPLSIMIFVWGMGFMGRFILLGLGPEWVKNFTGISKLGTVVAMVLFVDLVLVKLLKAYAAKIELLRVSETLSSIIVHLVVLSMGALITLDSLGISITPIMASLGIGSLAVALALQPTLENVFSGLQIILDRPVAPGQFIKLESGEEGYVERIGWRSTWVRQLSNNMVIIPNKMLVNTRVTNFYYPSTVQAVLVDVSVHYNTDLEKAERVAIEVAGDIMKRVTGGVPNFQPMVRYNKLSASSIDMTVIMQAKEFVDNYLIKHEFIKALAKRFGQEGIVMPYPVTAINTTQEKALVSSVN